MSWRSPVDGPIPAPVYGEPDADGDRAVTGYEPGYRLNVPPELVTAAIEPCRITPAEPMRVFAGDDPAAPAATVFLLFADEAAAIAALAEWWRGAV